MVLDFRIAAVFTQHSYHRYTIRFMTGFPLQTFLDTPTLFYYYDMELLAKTLDAIGSAAPEKEFCVHYAVKANCNPAILKFIAGRGLGADCVSGGEIRAALEAGFPAAKIVFAGVGKTDSEINFALDCGIGCFNVESIPELEVINELASARGLTANIALRVNPDIDAHTHHYITTGLEENKFGIALEMLDDAIACCMRHTGLHLAGLHFHIGSQITINEPFVILCERVNTLVERYADQGIDFEYINVGGGLGVDYDNPDANPVPDFESYFGTFRKHLALRPGQSLHFELGRAVTAQCGSLISRVLYVKEGVDRKFVIADAGMTDLIRPALYGAHHLVQNITSKAESTEKYDVVGPICESSDCFGSGETLPETRRGDLLAFRTAGAYGEVMASRYNCRNLPGAVFGK